MSEVSRKTINSFAEIDAMPLALRECVHEFGFAIVKACVLAGVSKPNAIRQLVREIWAGARQPGQRGKLGGVPTVYNTLDWVLMQAGENISAATLARILTDNNHVIAPKDPTAAMVAASISAIHGMGLMTKTQKHTYRLQAALRVAGEAGLRSNGRERAA